MAHNKENFQEEYASDRAPSPPSAPVTATARAATLHGATLSDAQAQGASLHNADLRVARLSSARLQGASFSGARLEGASLEQAQLQGANFEKSKINGADFSAAAVWRANFFDVENPKSSGVLANRLDSKEMEERSIDQIISDITKEAPEGPLRKDALRSIEYLKPRQARVVTPLANGTND
ncbi:MAG: pentapeptide repeat-containing protein, partial [Methylocystis sp.]|nr:pentapeptide repeat-containing protein [Methylocystis sp.]